MNNEYVRLYEIKTIPEVKDVDFNTVPLYSADNTLAGESKTYNLESAPQDDIWVRLRDLDEKVVGKIINSGIVPTTFENVNVISSPANRVGVIDNIAAWVKGRRARRKPRSLASPDDPEEYILPVVNTILVGNHVLRNPKVSKFEDCDLCRIIDLYTAKRVDGGWKLDPILTLIHGSELFNGETEYENNVFAKAKDLTEKEKIQYADKLIKIGDLEKFFNSPAVQSEKNF